MTNYTLAGFGNRFLAVIIDGFIASIVFSFLFIPINTLGLITLPSLADLQNSEDEAAGVIIASYTAALMGLSFCYGIAYLLYETFMISSAKQATLGKMALKLRVVTEDGQRLTTGQALGRSLLKGISGNVCFLLWLWPLFNDKEQALHDLIVKDLVIKNSEQV